MRVLANEPLEDLLKDSVCFDERLPIVEAQYMKARLPQARRPRLIRLRRVGFEVLAAIEFDDQSGFDAREVREEEADRVLAAELEAAELARTQALPDGTFGVW